MGSSKGPAFRENIHRLFDEAQSADLAPGIVSLIESRATRAQIREIGVDKILPNPAQPRLSYEEDSLTELADSIREHGVLQPILVRLLRKDFELVAGEHGASAQRGLPVSPACLPRSRRSPPAAPSAPP